jgi:hypothetical protein
MIDAEEDQSLVYPVNSAGCASWPSGEAPESRGCAYEDISVGPCRRRQTE